MKSVRALFPPFVGGRIGLGLLVLRLAIGLGMMVHGWGKVTSPGGPSGWFTYPGAPAPWMQAIATAGEFLGGLGLVVGALTPIAALGVIATMMGAMLIAQLPTHHPWISTKPGSASWEDVGFYLFGALALLLTGPGLFSVDAQLFGRQGERPEEVRLPGERVRN